MRILITGGAGFIGSAVVRAAIAGGHNVVNVDCLTYAGNIANNAGVAGHVNYAFQNVDICDAPALSAVFEKHTPDTVIHLAAESHVDRSIDAPDVFIQTNVVGTVNLLQLSKVHNISKFVHVSTDEVYGDLGPDDAPFTPDTAYDPHSPYAASKAASDHLARAWHRTYGLPVTVTNCSNNYGPYQFPEKLIPVTILKALAGHPIPIYGTGDNIRDWLYVDDHASALIKTAQSGVPGQTYCIGGNNEQTNLNLVKAICKILDAKRPLDTGTYADLISFVTDRPGHDRRYAIDSAKIETELGWKALMTFEAGLSKTVDWYLDNRAWWEPLLKAGAAMRKGSP